MHGTEQRSIVKVFSGAVAVIVSCVALAPKIAIGFGALVLVAGGGLPWVKFGSLVYFDMLAATFAGRFR